MTSYRRTISRYRRILRIPIILCVGLALWTVAGSPKQYESSISLWVDNPPPAESSLTNTDPVLSTPADAQQQVVAELLQTRGFRLAVGRRSPLAPYLASGPSKGWSPMGLIGAARGAKPLDVQILDALGPKKVTTTVAGPQLLQVSYHAGTPAVAAGTLKALVAELNRQLSSLTRDRSRAALSFYQAQVTSASKAVADARSAVSSYMATHPGASASDPQLKALVRAEKASGPSLARATTRLNQATSAVQGAPTPSAHLTIIDQPDVPKGPMGGKKKLVMALFGGLFVGLIIAFLLLIALTPSRPDEWDVAVVEPWVDDFAPLGGANGHAGPLLGPNGHGDLSGGLEPARLDTP